MSEKEVKQSTTTIFRHDKVWHQNNGNHLILYYPTDICAHSKNDTQKYFQARFRLSILIPMIFNQFPELTEIDMNCDFGVFGRWIIKNDTILKNTMHSPFPSPFPEIISKKPSGGGVSQTWVRILGLSGAKPALDFFC